jgi:hypothetical protein
MTTLGKLKTDIAEELARTDLTSGIAKAIAGAIRHYRRTRFYFNVLESIEFDTVEDQSTYDKSDLAEIANIIRIDNVFLVKDDGTDELDRKKPAEIELMLPANVTSSVPGYYSYENQKLRIAAPPNSDDYVIRVFGQVWIDAPEADDTADNPWMIEAYDLLKYRAKASLYADYMEDLGMAQPMSAAEQEQLRTLEGETNMRASTGFVEPTQF